MEKENIIFELPDESTDLVDVIYDILDKNGLGLSDDPDKWPEEKEKTQAITIQDAAIDVFKKIPEEKILLSLQKYLNIDSQKAKDVLFDIQQKIVPYIKVTKPGELSAQEIIMEKIRSHQEAPQTPSSGIKKPSITNVEENAQALQKEKKYTDDFKKFTQEEFEKKPAKTIEKIPIKELPDQEDQIRRNGFDDQKASQDSYREPIE